MFSLIRGAGVAKARIASRPLVGGVVVALGMSGRAVMVIGNFDGVHTGHRAVIADARARADRDQMRLVAFTFDPHPQEVITGRVVPKLCSLQRRLELLRAAGADEVLVTPFTHAYAQTLPSEFACMMHDFGAACVYVGQNFRFGKQRVGDAALLAALGAPLGFDVRTTELFGASSSPVSSSRIRACLAEGDVLGASRMLGRPHRLVGTVVHGDALGRSLGFPTANLSQVAEMLPAYGVYAVQTELQDGQTRPGVMNVGVRPTLGAAALRVEVHLLDTQLDLYGQELKVDIVARIREEKRFDSLDALRAQIAEDVSAARSIFRAGTMS